MKNWFFKIFAGLMLLVIFLLPNFVNAVPATSEEIDYINNEPNLTVGKCQKFYNDHLIELNTGFEHKEDSPLFLCYLELYEQKKIDNPCSVFVNDFLVCTNKYAQHLITREFCSQFHTETDSPYTKESACYNYLMQIEIKEAYSKNENLTEEFCQNLSYIPQEEGDCVKNSYRIFSLKNLCYKELNRLYLEDKKDGDYCQYTKCLLDRDYCYADLSELANSQGFDYCQRIQGRAYEKDNCYDNLSSSSGKDNCQYIENSIQRRHCYDMLSYSYTYQNNFFDSAKGCLNVNKGGVKFLECFLRIGAINTFFYILFFLTLSIYITFLINHKFKKINKIELWLLIMEILMALSIYAISLDVDRLKTISSFLIIPLMSLHLFSANNSFLFFAGFVLFSGIKYLIIRYSKNSKIVYYLFWVSLVLIIALFLIGLYFFLGVAMDRS